MMLLAPLFAAGQAARSALLPEEAPETSLTNSSSLLGNVTTASKVSSNNFVTSLLQGKKCKVKSIGGGCSLFKKCCDLRADGGPRLTCQPGVHKCYPHPRLLDQPCSAGFPCSDDDEQGHDYYCKSGAHKCVSRSQGYDPCGSSGIFNPRSTSCGTRQPTCFGSRLCSCSLLPNFGSNAGYPWPCPNRIDVDKPLERYEVKDGKRKPGKDLTDTLHCCPDGKLYYENYVDECATECDKSDACMGFTLTEEDKVCVFKKNVDALVSHPGKVTYRKPCAASSPLSYEKCASKPYKCYCNCGGGSGKC
jgi:hypothetical protein